MPLPDITARGGELLRRQRDDQIAYLDGQIAYLDAKKPLLAAYRASTATDINVFGGIDIPWDNVGDRRQDAGISIDAGHTTVTVAGQPDRVRINVNIRANYTSGLIRPNQIIEVYRNDARVIAMAATGYIRNDSGHNTASYNISAMDFAPLNNGTYKIRSFAESSTAVVQLGVFNSQFDIEVLF